MNQSLSIQCSKIEIKNRANMSILVKTSARILKMHFSILVKTVARILRTPVACEVQFISRFQNTSSHLQFQFPCRIKKCAHSDLTGRVNRHRNYSNAPSTSPAPSNILCIGLGLHGFKIMAPVKYE